MDEPMQNHLEDRVAVRHTIGGGRWWRVRGLFGQTLGPWVRKHCWYCALGWAGVAAVLVAYFG